MTQSYIRLRWGVLVISTYSGRPAKRIPSEVICILITTQENYFGRFAIFVSAGSVAHYCIISTYTHTPNTHTQQPCAVCAAWSFVICQSRCTFVSFTKLKILFFPKRPENTYYGLVALRAIKTVLSRHLLPTTKAP